MNDEPADAGRWPRVPRVRTDRRFLALRDALRAAELARRMIGLDRTYGRISDKGAANRLSTAGFAFADAGEWQSAADAFEKAHYILSALESVDGNLIAGVLQHLSKARAMAASQGILNE